MQPATDHAPVLTPTMASESDAPTMTNSNDAARALRNAGSLGSSLLVTACLGFFVQFIYQDLLGTSQAGRVGGAESLSILLMGLMTFGVDTYARKEVALRSSSAKSFVSGVILFRAVATGAIIVLAALVLFLIGRPREAVWLFVLFGVARFIVQTNDLLLACLQAVGHVAGVGRVNIAAKVLWALIVISGVRSDLGAIAVPLGWLIAEAYRCLLLAARAQESLRIVVKPIRETTMMVLKASFPFTAGAIVANWSTYFDATLISFWFEDTEVGLYRYAQNITGVAFLVGTVLPWVLLPLASRARERSEHDYAVILRRGFQLVLTIAIPCSVLLSLNADTVVSTLGLEWSGAIPALRILAFTVIGTYVIMASMTFLVVEDQAWLTVRVGLAGIATSILLNVLLLRWGRERFGVGGAGTTAASIAVFAEFIVATLCLRAIGKKAWDRRSLTAIARVVGSAVIVAVLDRYLAEKGLRWGRLMADAVVYATLLLVSGAVKLSELKELLMKRSQS